MDGRGWCRVLRGSVWRMWRPRAVQCACGCQNRMRQRWNEQPSAVLVVVATGCMGGFGASGCG
eukprot:15443591-Alexandrium_andersonii.AAC.1